MGSLLVTMYFICLYFDNVKHRTKFGSENKRFYIVYVIYIVKFIILI